MYSILASVMIEALKGTSKNIGTPISFVTVGGNIYIRNHTLYTLYIIGDRLRPFKFKYDPKYNVENTFSKPIAIFSKQDYDFTECYYKDSVLSDKFEIKTIMQWDKITYDILIGGINEVPIWHYVNSFSTNETLDI